MLFGTACYYYDSTHDVHTTLKESYSNEVTLTDLDPYTSYTIQGAASNYYTEYLSEALSRPFYFRTQVGGQSILCYFFSACFYGMDSV